MVLRLVATTLFCGCLAQDFDLGALLGGLGGAGGAGANGNKPRKLCSKKELIVPRLIDRIKKGTLIANGCGPSGMPVKEPFGLWRCCNRHDVCFSSCSTSFEFCERKFEQCMKKRCKVKENAGQEAECKQQATSMSSMTKMFGKGIHESTMFDVCDCASSKEEARSKRREWILDIYKRFGPSDKAENDTFIDETLDKHAGKEGNLYYELITKYGAAEGFVDFHGIANSFEPEGPNEVPPSSSASSAVDEEL